MTLHQPRSTLFPYTTLFRSSGKRHDSRFYYSHGKLSAKGEPYPLSRATKVDRKHVRFFLTWTTKPLRAERVVDRKSTRLNSSHLGISYAVFCLKKKNKKMKT